MDFETPTRPQSTTADLGGPGIFDSYALVSKREGGVAAKEARMLPVLPAKLLMDNDVTGVTGL